MLSSPQTVPRAASEARLVRQLRSVRGSGARASKPAPTGQSRRPAAPARSARLRWQASRRQCRRRETRYKDPVILQSQGQVSRLLVRGIDIMATQRHELGEMLAPPQVTRRIFQQVERLTKDCLNEGEGGRLLVLINVLEQLRIDGAHDFVQESAHARVTFEPVLLQPQLRAQRR